MLALLNSPLDSWMIRLFKIAIYPIAAAIDSLMDVFKNILVVHVRIS